MRRVNFGRIDAVRLALALMLLPLCAIAQQIEPPGLTSDGTGSSEPIRAEKATSQTADRKPETPNAAARAAFNQGIGDLKQRDFKTAAEHFEQALKAAPGYAAAYAERGGARIGLGSNDLAIADLTKALELMGGAAAATERARLYGNRGLAYLNLQRYETAVADFDIAIDLDPKLAFAYANRGISHLRSKNVDAALRDATHAIELRPNYEFALLLRGFAYTEKQQFPNAVSDFVKALAITPDNRGAILGLRQAYMAGKDNEEEATIKLVRMADAECEPACPEWVAIEGKIGTGSADELKAVLAETAKRKLPVFVDSGGGSVPEAMAMGRLIRARGLDVVVTRTELVACARNDQACKKRINGGRALGRAHAPGAICASSCGFLLASGARRFVGKSTLVGVHQITSFQTYQKVYRQYEVQRAYRGGRIVEIDRRVVSETFGAKKTVQTATNDETYVRIRKYFNEMGIDDSIMPLLISSPPKGMHWLTDAELKATALQTNAEHGEQMLLRDGVSRFASANAPAAAAIPASNAPQPTASPRADASNLDAVVLTKAIQSNLARVGCMPGIEDGKWGQGVRRALERYNALTGKQLKTASAAPETLDALAARSGLVCAPACPPDLSEVDGRCVAAPKNRP